MRITLETWGAGDIAVLRRANTPELTRFLGGPETEEALAQRHAEYLAPGDGARMFRVEVDGAAAGYAGWWDEEHDGEPVYEVGCVIEPGWQGQGVATIVLRDLVRRAGADGRPVVGYANIENAASNALCAHVGFSLQGTGLFPAAAGAGPTAVNVWMIRPPR